ncbi:camphor resistance protein CrcB [Alteribacillus persepolensis]|uniref:Fluoride-specific ion channel FluC n=1 Tax=Alteribacillus persepolensis TaxID=568899 RepID=A0A1G8GDZ9_9BACI|nr:CrcB family protein [Alteribacillus persepolensis]SDH92541.1 camphor resistance protein CrcB [Alteribacillus persepolensis]
MKNVIAVGAGAAVGTYLRYLLNIQTLAVEYPIGTLLENTTGSLLLGMLSGYFAAVVPKPWVKAGLGTGLCGGFTTFSTFASDTVWLYLDHNIIQSFLYVFVTLGGGVTLALLGFILGQSIGQKKQGKEKAGGAL